MRLGLDSLNELGNSECLGSLNDSHRARWYHCGMKKPRHDWYFNQWLDHSGKTQTDVVNDLGWNKSKPSLFAAGSQRYHRDDVNALAHYLNVEPFELLLPPERAMALRQLPKPAPPGGLFRGPTGIDSSEIVNQPQRPSQRPAGFSCCSAERIGLR